MTMKGNQDEREEKCERKKRKKTVQDKERERKKKKKRERERVCVYVRTKTKEGKERIKGAEGFLCVDSYKLKEKAVIGCTARNVIV